jgi:DNA primase large subunit
MSILKLPSSKFATKAMIPKSERCFWVRETLVGSRQVLSLRGPLRVYSSFFQVSNEEKAKFDKELRACTPPGQVTTFPQERFYKVHWTRVPRLVESRRVFLRGGMAYVPSREQPSFIIQEFQSNLEHGLLVR